MTSRSSKKGPEPSHPEGAKPKVVITNLTREQIAAFHERARKWREDTARMARAHGKADAARDKARRFTLRPPKGR